MLIDDDIIIHSTLIHYSDHGRDVSISKVSKQNVYREIFVLVYVPIQALHHILEFL
jgi:hypothetical protein